MEGFPKKNSNKLLIVVGSDGLESGIGVCLAELQRQTGYFTGFPFFMLFWVFLLSVISRSRGG